MAKIAILDDYEALGKLTAGPLTVAGYEARIFTSPINFNEVLDFGPDLIEINLYRQKDALDRPIQNIERDVLGFKPLVDLEKYPAAHITPLLLVGIGIIEESIPTSLHYDLFLSFPEDIDLYLPAVLDLTARKKGRRKVSMHVCPVCKGRLTYTQKELDLFCPRCHTSVVIIQGTDECLYMQPGGQSLPCKTSDLLAPKGKV